jgi:3-hydroxyacyl-[acyl-carrier-protein] dehydratase
MMYSTGTILRHCQPFLFVDSFKPLADDSGVETSYRYTGDEEFFSGHFPGDPIVPGVLLIEAMAQAARLALIWRLDSLSFGNLVGISRARFNKIIRPSATVRFLARVTAIPDTSDDSGFFGASCTAFFGNERAARADLTLSVRRPIVHESEAFWPGREAVRQSKDVGRTAHAIEDSVPV